MVDIHGARSVAYPFSLISMEEQRKILTMFKSLIGEQIWIPDHNSTGVVFEPVAPSYYIVSVQTGIIKRNWVHLHHLLDNSVILTIVLTAE